MREAPLEIGDIVADHWRVDARLGGGAMGVVFLARHVLIDKPVAIKVLTATGDRKEAQETRFRREARLACKITSCHAARMYDIDALPNGARYIIMEYLEGQDLQALIDKRGPLPVEEALTYVLQACHAIAEAHTLGIVHRDIKPANLFLTDIGIHSRVKVIDFGIAKQDGEGPSVTDTGAGLGSPLYMSPEQMRGARDVDARADIWSLGVTLYQLLTGTTPFHAATVAAVCMRVGLDPPTPIADLRPDVPPGLAAVIEQCFEKDRERRWPSIAALTAALAPYAPAGMIDKIAQLAGIQESDIQPSRPTTELAKPTDEALASAKTAAMASTATEGVPVAPVNKSAPERAGLARAKAAVVVGGAALGFVVATALFSVFRGAPPTHPEPKPPPVSVTVAGEPGTMGGDPANPPARPAEPAPIVAPEEPPRPAATAMATGPTVRPAEPPKPLSPRGATAPVQAPRTAAAPKPAPTTWAGGRR